MSEHSDRPRPRPRLLAKGLVAARFWRWVLLALVVVVAWLALQPLPPATMDLGWDKLNHGAAFAALAFSAWLGHAGSMRRRAWALVALVVYGALIEALQSWVPQRHGDWLDLLADVVGLALGAATAAVALRSLTPPPGAQREGVGPRA